MKVLLQGHPALRPYLFRTGTPGIDLLEAASAADAEAAIVSEGGPGHRTTPESLLHHLAELRLNGFNGPVLALSFLSRAYLQALQEGWLLDSTEITFMRLPVPQGEVAQMLHALEAPTPSELAALRIRLALARLAEEVVRLQHGGRLDMVNTLTGPLRIACLNWSRNPKHAPAAALQRDRVAGLMADGSHAPLMRLCRVLKQEDGHAPGTALAAFALRLAHLEGVLPDQGTGPEAIISDIDALIELRNAL